MLTDPSARIINHMNKDHQMALNDYLIAYGGVKGSDLDEDSSKIAEIDEKQMKIIYKLKSKPKFHVFSITWNSAPEKENVQVQSLKDLRAKLVSMAKYAAEKQGYSHIKIKKVLLPRPQNFILYPILGLLLLAAIDVQEFKRLLFSDPLFLSLSSYVPKNADFFFQVLEDNTRLIFLTYCILHATEVLFGILPKLIKYRVPFFKKIAWIVMTFVEGIFALRRFNSLLESEH